MRVKWTDKIPAEPGYYWFYGDPFAEKEMDIHREIHLVRVRRGGNSLIFVTDGNFMYTNHKCQAGLWAAAELPDKP